VKSNTRPDFAHQTEETFARILEFYGIEWEYEPRTFPIEWDDNNNVVEAFTPDFFLPQQNLYIELTTLRPELASHKNRKLRRVQELYPEINIKLFKRREMRSLMVKYGLDKDARDIKGSRPQGT
jgi:hypothetical protein